MYARTIVLELVKRADEAAKREDDAAQHEKTAGCGEATAAAAAAAAVVATSGAASAACVEKAPETEANLFAEDESAAVDMHVTSSTLNCNGALFDWWVLGERPALVTVRHASLGKVSGFTEEAPEAFALGLAKQLVDQHLVDQHLVDQHLVDQHDNDADMAARTSAGACAPSPLKKPGWFEK